MKYDSQVLCVLIFFFFFKSGLSQVEEVNLNENRADTTKTTQLDEVFLTATRTERQLSSLPLPAQLITKKEIQNINSVRLTDILNEQTGLITVPDFGGGEGIQLQGLDSQYTLILIDGVPLVGRSAGTLDLSRLTVGNIKQIEVVKGASSSLYGSEALGGVINIITENPKEGFKGNLRHRAGSFNTQDLSTNLNFKKKKLGINAFFNRYSSDGYDLVDNDELNTVEPFSNYTLTTKVSYDFSENTKLLLSGRYYTQEQDNIASATLKGESSINEWNAHLKFNHKFNQKWSTYFEFYTTQYIAEEFLNDEASNSRFSESDFDQRFLRPEIRASYTHNKKHAIIGGIGLTRETLDRTDFFEKPEFNSPYIYAQYDAYPLENLNLIIGFRYDDHSEYESQFSPKIALRYEFTDKLAAKGSVGYGFKAPDFRQLYFDFTNATVGYTVLGYNAVPSQLQELADQGQLTDETVNDLPAIIAQFNDALKPESSISYNFGIDYKPVSALKLNVNLFRNDITNLIDTRVIARKSNGQNVFSYTNVDEVYTQGIEFNTNWKVTSQLTLSGGYQLLYAKDKTAEQAFENGEVFARENPASPSFQLTEEDYFGLYNRSRHLANFKVFYTIPDWNLNTNLRATYRSKFGLFDTNGNTYLDDFDTFVESYTIWDLAINKTFYDNYQLGLGVDNLFDFTDPQNISNISGRILYGKLNIKF
ncbi:TonB-dependent receptor plug domain-containing protein [Aquimarina sp. 2201CG5-10]|uniref:TonB-dependent receptor plug domain-containing protein n=1 Tax=Aquimarina callyspongiae TaxID=3098150 RepID=UPI002AB552D4|nr:TonB-dependent receptor [Aquimarina sp. 2201CG5-10]MDY8138407.1 TonB-dependent receptor [Aquimarina sp. 2201CG5-10]